MSLSVEELEIKINSDASSADDAIDRLVTRLDKLIVSLGGLDSGKLVGLANGVQRLSTAVQGMNAVKTSDFTRLAKNLEKIGNINTASLNSAASSLNQIGKAFNSIGNMSNGVKQIAELANGIKQLGYKSAGKALTNIPLLATAMKDLMTTLSTAPQVSQNIIDMTNALAKLARTGASSGKAANALSAALNGYSKSTVGARAKTFSLASAIGKLYATYWMLLRALNLVKEAINIASDITEVQNVVDTTFGEYSGLVDKMSETSIQDLGMSELTVKQVASRFQAMGTAMGFTRGQMADMSIELTKLTADMASFYNVEQSAVAEDLASIFTGQARPLRTYGLDLTEATLAEWAMKQGMDANISSMTQAEKALLRYQYVMANTGAAQGDFLKTQDTWANQVRILNENFRQLGGIVGGTLINAFKPFVKAMNSVISAVIKFAKVVSDALGAIFGWEYQVGGGGIASDLETAESAAGGISDGVGGAADNAKKLKQQLAGIDELNVLKSDSSSGGGGSGGGGGASGGAETDADGGQWVQTEPIWEKYKSSLDSLYKLGEYISTTLTSAMASIDWDSIYKKAENFGTGLAEFLNGLIRPDLFYMVGRTIANSLNTAVTAGLAFADEFDFYEFGESIGTGITKFFTTFDWDKFATSINLWVDGLKDALAGFLKGLKWTDIVAEIGDFLGDLEIDTVGIIVGTVMIKKIKAAELASIALTKLPELVASAIGTLPLTLHDLAISFGSGALASGSMGLVTIGDEIIKGIDKYVEDHFGEEFLKTLGNVFTVIVSSGFGFVVGGPLGAVGGAIAGLIIDGIYNADELSEGLARIGEKIKSDLESMSDAWKLHVGIFVDDIKEKISEKWSIVEKWWGSKPSLNKVKFSFDDLLKNIKSLWNDIGNWWDKRPKLSDIEFSWDDLLGSISELWSNVNTWWKSKPSLQKISFSWSDLVKSISDLWSDVTKWWGGKKNLSTVSFTLSNLSGSISSLWSNVQTWWNNKKSLSTVSFTLSNLSSMISSAWSNARTWWNNKTPLSSISFSVGNILSPIQNAVNSLKNWWNNNKPSLNLNFSIKLPTLELVWDTWSTMGKAAQKLGLPGIPKFYVYWRYFENGGFPVPGSYFVAGENGVPEMLGTVGGRTAVASGAEITGIRDAVMSTGQEEIALLRQQNQLLLGILNKEFGITTDDIGRSARKYAKEYYKRTGNEAYSF